MSKPFGPPEFPNNKRASGARNQQEGDTMRKNLMWVPYTMGSGLHPFDSGMHPFDSQFHPFDSGLHPFDSGLHPFDSRLHPFGTAEHPFSNQGVADAPGPVSAMLAEALRTTRADLVDATDAKTKQAVPRANGNRFNIFRWEALPRQEACLFDLLSNLQFAQGSMWRMPAYPTANGAQAPQPFKVITLTCPNESFIRRHVTRVLARTPERGDRLPEILVQADDLWPFWTTVTNLDPTCVPRTFELIQLARRFATSVVMRLKHEFACARPADVSAQVQPVIPTPGHGSWPSGHATIAYMAADLFALLLPGGEGSEVHQQLERLAYRIADNRVVAGVHFPMDSVAGCLLGQTLAAYFHAACTGDAASIKEAQFLGAKLDDDEAETYEAPRFSLRQMVPAQVKPAKTESPGTPSALLKTMWDAAINELRALGYLPLAPAAPPTPAKPRAKSGKGGKP
jgi:hypothetical protein